LSSLSLPLLLFNLQFEIGNLKFDNGTSEFSVSACE